MGRSGGELPRGKRSGDSRGVRKEGDLWIARGRSLAIEAARERAAQGSETVHAHRKTGAAAGHALQSEWHGAIWTGCAAARNGVCGRREAAGVWRKSRERGCGGNVENSRRSRSGTGAVRRDRSCREILGREGGTRQIEDHLG